MRKVLIVESSPEIAAAEKDYLNMNGLSSDVITDGWEALKSFDREDYSLILLNPQSAAAGDQEICRSFRDKTDIPILIVSEKTGQKEELQGFRQGADDYIAIPFDPEILIARIMAYMKCYERLTGRTPDAEAASAAEDDIITVEDLRIYPRSRRVRKGEKEIHLPNKEFELLKFLAVHPNTVYSKEQLFDAIWGYGPGGDNATVAVHINRLREKIEDDPSHPVIIETLWSAGYRLNRRITRS